MIPLPACPHRATITEGRHRCGHEGTTSFAPDECVPDEHCQACPVPKQEAGPKPRRARAPSGCVHLGTKLYGCGVDMTFKCTHPDQPRGGRVRKGKECHGCPGFTPRALFTDQTPPHLLLPIIRDSLDDLDFPANWWQWANVQEAMRLLRRQAQAETPPYPEGRYAGKGLVMIGGGRYELGLYVAVRMLRHFGCELPVWIWHHGPGEPIHEDLFIYKGCTVRDSSTLDRRRSRHPFGPWDLKINAVLASPFRHVLYLDADCYPLRDVTPLFDHNPAGAVLWHDMPRFSNGVNWQLHDVDGGINEEGWDARGKPLAFQGGQWLLDLDRCWKAAWLYRRLEDFADFYWRHHFGDQGTMELAFAAVGQRHHAYSKRQGRAKVAYLPRGPDGEPWLLHRLGDKGFSQVRPRMPGEELAHRFAAEYRRLTTDV